MTDKRKFPTRAELLGLDRVKAVREKKAREKSASEKFASLTKKIQNLKVRATRANEAALKAATKLYEAETELAAVCPHKSTFIATNMRGEEIAQDLGLKPALFKWCKVCNACLGHVTSK